MKQLLSDKDQSDILRLREDYKEFASNNPKEEAKIVHKYQKLLQ